MSTYTDCACRTCPNRTLSSDSRHPDLCGGCKGANCDPDGEEDCQADTDEETRELDFEPMARVVRERLR